MEWNDGSSVAAETAQSIARRRVPFARSLDPFSEPFFVKATPEAFAAFRRVVEPIRDTAVDLETEAVTIAASPDLNEAGRQRALQALAAKRREKAVVVVPALKAAEDTATAIANLETSADLGATWDEKHRAFLRPDANRALTPSEDADVRETRAYWRSAYFNPAGPRLSDWRALYRSLVVANDQRARWAENDPTETLVSEADRAWAREWRIEHSPFLDQIETLRAKQRSLALIIESALRAFHVSEMDLRA
jgi:hypothetical protein